VEQVAPWENVFINLRSAGSFAEVDPNHGSIGCAQCHGGDPNAATMETAHSGDFRADPSADPQAGCGSCHGSLAEDFSTSLHFNLWGERAQVAQRAGYSSFNECPAWLQDSFNGECTACHATCGDCHVSRPNSVGGGLVDRHVFRAVPDREENCQACHGSRVAVDYSGELDGVRRDVHYPANCTELCHSGDEMHGDGNIYDQGRYHAQEITPRCTDCHLRWYGRDQNGEELVNIYHANHWPGEETTNPEKRLDCYVCHAQTYNNCDACHVSGEWKTDPAYQERNPYPLFKIGRNIAPENGKGAYVVVRHIPIARDTYANWGLETADPEAFDAVPNWKYASPHNVRKWTPQTVGSTSVPAEPPTEANCSIYCHLLGDNADLNRERFLTRAWMHSVPQYADDPAANDSVTVDDYLPPYWDN